MSDYRFAYWDEYETNPTKKEAKLAKPRLTQEEADEKAIEQTGAKKPRHKEDL
jgi:hypothetical protein